MMRLGLFITLGLLAAPLSAEPWRVGVYSGKWVDSRLPLIPYNLARGELSFEESQLTSVIVSRALGEVDIPIPFSSLSVDGIRFEAEATANVHSGLQDHEELTLAVMTRTADLDTTLGTLNFGWANGFSRAFSDPAYEKGTEGVRGEDTIPFQFYMAFEMEYAAPQWEQVSVFARLHHRSGIYGLISPSTTGSNFFGAGLRWDIGG